MTFVGRRLHPPSNPLCRPYHPCLSTFLTRLIFRRALKDVILLLRLWLFFPVPSNSNSVPPWFPEHLLYPLDQPSYRSYVTSLLVQPWLDSSALPCLALSPASFGFSVMSPQARALLLPKASGYPLSAPAPLLGLALVTLPEVSLVL